MTDSLRQIASNRSYPELLEAVEDLVVAVFRNKLLMEPDEQCDLDLSFFDMGLTSLRLTEIKQQLEAHLDLAIDPTVMFNRPTLPDLVAYLASLIERDVSLAS